MDTRLAKAIAEAELDKLRMEKYENLLKRVDAPEHRTVKGPDGSTWGVEVNVFHDDGHKSENLRVSVAVDDGGFRAFVPLCRDTIIGPKGEL